MTEWHSIVEYIDYLRMMECERFVEKMDDPSVNLGCTKFGFYGTVKRNGVKYRITSVNPETGSYRAIHAITGKIKKNE